jgi:phospholipid/cholesterol/gamma-HCH transport system substrate-binding protein
MRRALALGLVAAALIAAIVLIGAGGGNDGGEYKVRAIFDNASFLIEGQDVKVAGGKVGVVDKLEVTDDRKAAIVLRIDEDGFKDFRKDAHCEIRLQSPIGEKLVECLPTKPRSPGEAAAPPLDKIGDGEPGEGQYLLPVENTTTPVDADLVQSIMRRPYRERLSILLSEFGVGLTAKGEDIRELIRRGNPALKEFDDFLAILAGQNRMLKDLTQDADTVLAEFARARKSVANFFVQSRVAAQATAERREDFERNFEKFPAFLRELRPFMDRFAQLSEAMAPVISDLRASGPDVSRILTALGPFSRNSNAAIKSLGDTADIGRPALVGALPVAEQLAQFTSQARGTVHNLQLLLTDLDEHKGIERLMDLLFYQTLSFNGFDEVGHYLRNNLIVTICSGYALTPTVGCSANFQSASSASASSRASVSSISRRLVKLLGAAAKQKAERDRSQGGGEPSGTTGDSGANGTPKSEDKPKAESPSQPPAKQKPSVEQNGQRDALIDYLLGGAK